MRLKQELWNEDLVRLTVLIDLGRIKRNVATNVELGPLCWLATITRSPSVRADRLPMANPSYPRLKSASL